MKRNNLLVALVISLMLGFTTNSFASKKETTKHIINIENDKESSRESYTFSRQVYYHQEYRVPVCHKGRTVLIYKKALQPHINHGDALGACPVSDSDGDEEPTGFCGDNIIQSELGELCETSGITSCSSEGYAGFMACENGCKTFYCSTTESCGDGVVQSIEECDDGNSLTGDGCDSSCNSEVCDFSSFDTFQLTDNLVDDVNPKINNNNLIAWRNSQYNIFSYEANAGVVQITFDDPDETRFRSYHYSPSINNNNVIVWGMRGENEGVNIYSNNEIEYLNYKYSGLYPPQINDNDVVVWVGQDFTRQEIADTEILKYENSFVSQLTNNEFNENVPVIDSFGRIVWLGYVDENRRSEVFSFEDGVTIALTESRDVNNRTLALSDNGLVVWIDSISSGVPKMMSHKDGSIKIVTDRRINSNIKPKMNKHGAIVFQLADTNNLLVTSTEQQITNSVNRKQDSAVNSGGLAVWSELINNNYEIMLFDGEAVRQLTNNLVDDINPQINDDNIIVFQQFDGEDYELISIDFNCN